MYCRQFLADGLLDRDYCIYVSSSLTDKQFRTQFSNIENLNLIENSKFINPYLHNGPFDKQGYSSFFRDSSSISDNKTSVIALENSESTNKLSLTLAEIEATITHINRLAADDSIITAVLARILIEISLLLQLAIGAFAWLSTR